MALSSSTASGESRAFSTGPLKVQLLTLTAASGDTSGTITCPGLSTITHVMISGLTLTAAPTSSGNVITLAFADPLASIVGAAIVHGK
jgi:hypothetical protein